MTKKTKTIIISLTAVFVAAAVTVLALFVPRTGRKAVNIWSAEEPFNISKIQTLEKSADKPFKILLMTDLQLWINLSDNDKVYALMDETVAESDPDLIILIGDNVSGITTDMLTRQLIKKMESYNVPWAPVFGNHDSEGNATLEWQADRFDEAEHCLFERGPSNLYGVGNYALNVEESGKVIQTFVLFDNGRYTEYEDGSEKEIYLGYEQIAWYEWLVKGVAKAEGTVVPSMTFSHFAMPEFRTAIETLCEKRADGKYYVPERLGYGYCAYLPGSAPVNSGFFKKVKELGSTTHIFAGHDHENNASILYDGVRFTYGLKTGASPRYWNDAKEYGSTLITLSDGGVELSNIVQKR